MKRLLSIGLLLLWSATAPAAVIKTIQAGATDQTVVIKIIDSTDGTPETGVVFNTSGIDLEYWRHGPNSVTDITEATQTVSGAHTDGGFVALGNGYYRLDLPDAAVAAGATAVEVMGTVTGMIVIGGTVDLSPPVNVVSNAGTAITAASGRQEVNLSHIAGSAVSTSTAQLGVNVVSAGGTVWGSGAITAGSIATDAIGAAEIADGAIDAGALAADAITAAKIAADAIGSSEIAADAIGAAEVANGAIDAATFASGAIDATAIATDAIGAAEIAADAIGASELATDAIGAAEIAANAIAAAEIADGAIDAATFATTAGAFYPLGIIDQGTAQAATGTTLQLRSAASFADDEIIGATCLITGGSAGVGQARTVTDYVSSTDTATVSTWTTTPTGTITYECFGTAAASGGGASAADVWAYATRSLTVLDEDSTTIDLNATAVGSVAGSVGSIGTGGIASTSFAAGAIDAAAIAADAIGASEIATDAIGAAELAASAIGSSEIADGAITSAEFGSGAITATVIATDAIGAAELASDAGTEIGTATWATTTRLLTAGTNIVLAKGTGITGFNDLSAANVNAEVDTALADIHLDHLLAADYDPASKPGVATALLNELVESDAGVSRFTANALEQAPTGGGESLAAIADAVWDELLSGHAVSGSTGEALTSAAAGGGLDAAGVRAAIGLATANLDTQLADIPTVSEFNARTVTSATYATATALQTVDDNVDAVLVDTAEIGVAGAGLTAVDDAVLAAIAALNNLSANQVRDLVIEDQGGGVSLGCALAVLLAYASGDIATSGTTTTYEEPSGTETRTTGTVTSAGNRTATITCPTY